MAKQSQLSHAEFQRLLVFRTGIRRFLKWSEDQAIAAGLTASQHQLLLAVRGHPDRKGPTITDLRNSLLVTHHGVVGLVDRAVAAGLVVRHTDQSDRRAVRVELTDLGTEKLTALSLEHREELRRISWTFAQIADDITDEINVVSSAAVRSG